MIFHQDDCKNTGSAGQCLCYSGRLTCHGYIQHLGHRLHLPLLAGQPAGGLY